jgi:drug/metabolite transporter (DMT)-like permease
MSRTEKQGYAFALAAVVIWSGFILVSRIGGVSPLSSYDVIAIRYMTCASILLPVWLFKFRFQLLDIRLLVISLIGGLAYALFAFKGFELASASHAAVLLPGLMPFFIILLSVFINNEKHRLEKWLGVALISIGVAGLLWQKMSEGEGGSIGHLYLIGAALCWGIFSVLLKRWEIPPWKATISLALITCSIYMPVYLLWLPKNITLSSLSELGGDIALQAFYQGVMATIVQMLFYVRAIQIIGPSAVGSLMAFVPLIAGFSAIVYFGEELTGALIIGLVFVSAGACLSYSSVLGARGNYGALRQS